MRCLRVACVRLLSLGWRSCSQHAARLHEVRAGAFWHTSESRRRRVSNLGLFTRPPYLQRRRVRAVSPVGVVRCWSCCHAGLTEALPARPARRASWCCDLGPHRPLVRTAVCVAAEAEGAPAARLRSPRTRPTRRADWCCEPQCATPARPSCVVRWGWSAVEPASRKRSLRAQPAAPSWCRKPRSSPPARSNCGVARYQWCARRCGVVWGTGLIVDILLHALLLRQLVDNMLLPGTLKEEEVSYCARSLAFMHKAHSKPVPSDETSFCAAVLRKWRLSAVADVLRARGVLQTGLAEHQRLLQWRSFQARQESSAGFNARQRADIETIGLRECAWPSCDKVKRTVREFKQCSGCRSVWYCSPEHHTLDWGAHNKDCQKLDKARRAAMAAGGEASDAAR